MFLRIFLTVLFFIGGGLLYFLAFGSSRGDKATWLAIVGTICIFMGYVAMPLQEEEPKAIDVYRGRTTLQITYQDSIPLDSTVIWKN